MWNSNASRLQNKGAIYHHFKNKDELALAALEYNLKKISELHFNFLKKVKGSIERHVFFAESFRKNYDLVKHMGGCPIVNAPAVMILLSVKLNM